MKIAWLRFLGNGLLFLISLYAFIWFLESIWLKKKIENLLRDVERFQISSDPIQLSRGPLHFDLRLRSVIFQNSHGFYLKIPTMTLSTNIFFPYHRQLHIVEPTTFQGHISKLAYKGTLGPSTLKFTKRNMVRDAHITLQDFTLSRNKQYISTLRKLSLLYHKNKHPNKIECSLDTNLEHWSLATPIQELNVIHLCSNFTITNNVPSLLYEWEGWKQWKESGGKIIFHNLCTDFTFLDLALRIRGAVKLDGDFFPEGSLSLSIKGWDRIKQLSQTLGMQDAFKQNLLQLIEQRNPKIAYKDWVHIPIHLKDQFFFFCTEPLFPLVPLYFP